jgi:hypothetical protein
VSVAGGEASYCHFACHVTLPIYSRHLELQKSLT